MTVNKKPRIRDHKKEYAQKKKRASLLSKLLGVELSPSQARGRANAKKGEKTLSALRKENQIPNFNTSTFKTLDNLISKMFREGKSLSKAARETGITPRTARNIIDSEKLLDKKPNKKFGVLVRYNMVIATDGVHSNVPLDAKTSSQVQTHNNFVNAAKNNLESRKKLAAFKPRKIKDLHGNVYKLETNFEALILGGYYEEIRASTHKINADGELGEVDDEKVYKKEVV